MKKITLVMAMLCAITALGQQKVPQHVQELISAKTTFRPVAPLQLAAVQNNPRVAQAVSNATLATLTPSLTQDIQQHKYAAIELSVPYNGSNITMQLYRTEIFAEGFQIDTDKKNNVSYTPGAYYRGMVKGDPTSIASFSFFANEMNGIVASQQLGGNVVVGKLLNPGNVQDYVVYNDVNFNGTSSFGCGVTDDAVLPKFDPKVNKSALDVASTRCVTVYMEMDYDLFVANNSDLTTAGNWITSVFNNTQTLYSNDGISTALKSSFIWTEQDPYTGTSSSDYLALFRAGFSEAPYFHYPNYNGDVAMLVGIDEGGLGGLAATIDGLCTPDTNKCYGDIDFSFSNVPSYSWTVEVITHELGHLLGSPHTHGCYWNGDNTAIDGCGTTAGYVEGDCPIGPIPSASVKGTIMSYCHLVGGVGINLSNGFGPQPTARILDAVQSSTCLSTDCVNTCINTTRNVTVTAVTPTSITISWEDDGSAGPWQVARNASPSNLNTSGSVIGQFVDATTNQYTFTGLTPNTYYRFAVRPKCESGTSGLQNIITSATGADWCSGTVSFKDSGNNSNYPNGQRMIRVIQPDTAGMYATVDFQSFDTEPQFDVMYVYDGIGTNPATLLEGPFSGTDIPGPFQASNPTGALTFLFTSDSGLNATGWDAVVGCADTPAGTKQNSFANLSYYPNPVNGLLTISAPQGLMHVAIYNVAGQLITERSATGTSFVTDMSAYANGVYFVKVNNGDSATTLKVMKQ